MSEYTGQKLNSPVANGATPIHPHTPIVPIKVSTINSNPTAA